MLRERVERFTDRILSRPWPLRPLFEWISAYPFLAVVAALPLLIVHGAVGSQLGLRSLFHADDIVTQIAAGFAAAMLLGQVTFSGYFLHAEEKWVPRDKVDRPGLRWYFFYSATYPLLWVILFLSSFFYAPRVPWFAAGTLLGMAGVVALIPLAPILAAKFFKLIRRQRAASEVNSAQIQVGFAVILFLIYVIMGLAAWRSDPATISGEDEIEVLAPAVVLCALLGFITAAYSGVRRIFPRRSAFAVLLIVLLALILASLAGPTHYRDLDYSRPRELSAGPRADLPLQISAFRAWQERCPDRPLVLIATSGGGIRAAVWTAVVIRSLERAIPGISGHVRIITGASGGMVGASALVAKLSDPGPGKCPPGLSAEVLDQTIAEVGKESLRLPVQRFLSPFGPDRGTALELAWERNVPVLRDLRLAELAAGELAGWRPTLVFSPMVVEDGRRLLISNLDFAFATTSTGTFEGQTYAVSGLEYGKLFPDTKIRVTTAARMNASFPYVSPATVIPTIPERRLVDAGYYDNYGVNLAAHWLIEMAQPARSSVNGVLLVQIRDRLSHGGRVDPANAKTYGIPHAIAWLSTPLEAFVRSRESTMAYRNDELLEIVAARYNNSGDPHFFVTHAFELRAPAPLSWSLTESERAAILSDIEKDAKNQQALAAVRDWWCRRVKC